MALERLALSGILMEGNLLSADMLPDLVAGEVKGQASEDFGLAKTIKLADEIAAAWGDAKAYWGAFQRALARLPEGDAGTTITREQWVVPLLRSLGYAPVYVAKAEVVEGQTFAISHRAEMGEDRPPIHVVGCGVGLEQRPPSGIPRLSAHALMQEFLNRTEQVWGLVTNGLRWRLLRDSSLMTRLTYVEFDLEQILNGENFAEFGLFYRLFHRSRLPQTEGDECLLEFYYQESLQRGGRVRDRLRDGVERALVRLGTGFLQHPQSQELRDLLAAGEVSEREFYRQVLLLIYRLLFLMVAESRNLLLSTEDPEKVRIYREYYSVERLRALAERRSWRREGFQDLWQGLRVTFQLFDENWRGSLLGLSPLNGDLFGSGALGLLDGCGIDNHDVISAMRELSLYEQKGRLRRVNYGALDVEELGSVYESLLDFHPQVKQQDEIWEFLLVTGSERKTTGSYYTPPELVGQLIKSALEPVIEQRLAEALTPAKQEAALLSLKVCDPACGSGHFLLAAARRIGKELAKIRTGEAQPGPVPLRQAIRDVIQHCIYGVDLNPLAVDLCKVALWIEGFCQGMPLTFLDHRIKCGNSLVGVFDLEVLKEGIPDGAYKPVVGDDKKLASTRKKDNKEERKGQGSVFDQADFETDRAQFAELWQALGAIPEETPAQIRQKQSQYEAGRQDPRWWNDRTACNLWTAAFFTPITAEGLALVPTTAALARLLKEAQGGQRVTVSEMVAAANRLAEESRFFHWPLEFPEVFMPSSPVLPPSPSGRGAGGEGGFDCVLGNPPWERIKLQEKEFFAARDYEIATAQNKAAREKLIKTLPERKPELALEWQQAKHEAENQGVFIRESGRFPLTSRGDINTYAVFSELARNLIGVQGRSGIIVPTGIARDDTCKYFFGSISQGQNLASLFDFENRENIFPGVGHGRYKFSMLTLSALQVTNPDFSFFLTKPAQVGEAQRVFKLSAGDIKLLNPNTLTCPVLRTRQDAEITKKIYQRVPVLENEKTQQNPWGISFMRMFDMSNDSGLFQNEQGEGLLPLYEAKMFWHFDHRYGDYADYPEGAQTSHLPDVPIERLQNPDHTITPRYWVSRSEVENRLAGKWDQKWFLSFRAIGRATDERTFISTLIPYCSVSGKAPRRCLIKV